MESLSDCQHALEAFVAYASLVDNQDLPMPRWGARAIGVLLGEVKRLQALHDAAEEDVHAKQARIRELEAALASPEKPKGKKKADA